MDKKKYLKLLLIRVLVSIILFLALSIFVNYSSKNLLLFKNNVYDKSFKFSKINKLYNTYFGKPVISQDKTIIASKEINYTSANSFKDGAVLNGVDTIYPYKSGIVVFVGDKDDYGSTVIIEGMDGIDYWYGNITDKDNKLYVVFMKDNKVLSYEDYI